MGICEVLIPLTNSSSSEVQGNSATVLGNLSYHDGPATPDVYSALDNVWAKPEGAHCHFDHFATFGVGGVDPQMMRNIYVLVPKVCELAFSCPETDDDEMASEDAQGRFRSWHGSA